LNQGSIKFFSFKNVSEPLKKELRIGKTQITLLACQVNEDKMPPVVEH